MSVKEALIQLQFSQKRKAVFLARVIRSAATAGASTFYMDRDRLIVNFATATKGTYLKRVNLRAKGQADMRFVYFCHLRVGVSEQPYEENEKR